MSASVAVAETEAVPPTEVSSGPTAAAVMFGQLSPWTSVAVTPRVPVEPGADPVPHCRVIGTEVVWFARTGNAELVPVQAWPALVVAVRLTVSPASPAGVTGRTTSSEILAFGSLTLIVPEARTAL